MERQVQDAIRVLNTLTSKNAEVVPSTKLPRKRSRIERLVDEHSPGTVEPLPPPTTSRHEPWSREQYLSRLRTFCYARNWFAKPESISPARCARHGWTLLRSNVLSCATCAATLSFTASLADGQLSGDVEALGLAFVGRLRSGHAPTCPWLKWRCPPAFATVTVPPPHSLLSSLALQTAQLWHSEALSIKPTSPLNPAAPQTLPFPEISISLSAAGSASAVLTFACGGHSQQAPVHGLSGAHSPDATTLPAVPIDAGTVLRAVDAAGAVIRALAERLSSGTAHHGTDTSARSPALAAAALLTLCGWSVVPSSATSAASPHVGHRTVYCKLCDATVDLNAVAAIPSHPSAPLADGTNAALSTRSGSAPHAASGSSSGGGGLMSAARRALAAASRALSALRGPAPAGEAPDAAEPAGAATTTDASVVGTSAGVANPKPSSALSDVALSGHRWYCPMVRSGTPLPASLAILLPRLADTTAALMRRSAAATDPVAVSTASPALVNTRAQEQEVQQRARAESRGRRREAAEATGRAVSAGLASLSSAALGVADFEPSREQQPQQRHAASVAYVGSGAWLLEHADEDGEADVDSSGVALPPLAGEYAGRDVLRRIPGWLLVVLATISSAQQCATPSGDILPF
jgi:hypothetical protein